MKRFLLVLCLILGSSNIILLAQGDGELLLSANFSDRSTPLPETLRVVSFNLHGPPTKRIEEVFEVLRQHQTLREADVYLLQEVNRGHAGSGNRDIGRELASLLKTHYTYAVEIEHDSGGGVRGLAVLSRFPLEDTNRIQLPVEGPGGRRRIALGVTVRLAEARLRLYNLHLETRISTDQRMEQIRGVLEDARQFDGVPTVIAGDFNTITTSAVEGMKELLLEEGYSSPLPGDQITFQRAFIVRMVLDWIWARNIPILEAGIESNVRVSDHRPLWFDISVNSLRRNPSAF